MDAKSLAIVVLLIAVAGLGYLYYDSQQSSVRINAPGVDIQAN